MAQTPPPRTDHKYLRQIIAGLAEGVILLGTDGAILGANEAALAMHGVAALEALGGDAAGYRARFALRYRNNHTLGPGDYPMERVAAGETFEDVTVQLTHADAAEPRWILRIRGLILADAEGAADYCALVLADETERFSAEDRFERTFEANPAPAAICALETLQFVKVNTGFLELTGLTRAGILGQPLAALDVLEHAEQAALARERLAAGRTIPQMETSFPRAGGGRKYAIVAGQPIELGDEPCMLFTFMDLDPRKAAETALRQSEERFARAFRLTPIPTIVTARADFRLLDVNDAFAATFGHTAIEVAGRSTAAIGLWETPATAKLFEQTLAEGGVVRNLDLRARTKDGDTLDCLVSAETLVIGTEPCVLATIQDITERKRSETDLMAAIETVMQDASWFSRTVIEKLANLREPPGARRADAGLAALTGREREVLGLICGGLADAEIATALGLSRNTVRNQVAAIYAKVDIHRRPALIVWARERGVTGPRARTRKPGEKHHTI